MTLDPGSRLGVYEIVAPLGAGGMGEVYRARDSRLSRDVAIKILPAAFAADAERLLRFEREARVLASLNHPNIAQIYDVDQSGPVPALIMELVDGQDGAALIAAGPVALPQVRRIATQLIEALSAAHERGIIHRDLKPANMKVTDGGTVKVLDFGLAKVLDATSGTEPEAARPTVTSAGTRIGVVLGTASYMAPEQAKGVPADKRVDVWAFGCILFELLTGRPAFPGATISETIAAVLEREPEWDLLPAATPAGLRRLLRRCLEKDPKRRLQDIADARPDVEETDAAAPVPAVAAKSSRSVLPWALSLVLVPLAAGAGWWLRPVPAPAETRLEITTPPTPDASLAFSPDGRWVVFSALSEGRPQLWLRGIDAESARPLTGTEQGTLPFWSADSQSIGFFAGTQLKRLELSTGATRTVVRNIAVPIGGSWNRDGVILFSANPGGPVHRVSAEGGESTPVTAVDMPRQRGHYFPQFLPDGRHFLFMVVGGSAEAAGVYLGQLGDTRSRRILDSTVPPVYASTGHLLVAREGKLLAHPFDAGQHVASGDPIELAGNVSGQVRVTASLAGPIAYRSGVIESGQRQLVWMDRSGKEIEKVVYADTAALGPAVSHDGSRVAVYRFANRNMDIWSYDTKRRTWARLTFEPGDDIYPLWSPVDTSIVYGALRGTEDVGIYRRAVGAPAGEEEKLLPGQRGTFPMDWSADGRFLLYGMVTTTGGADLWAMPLQGERKAFAIANTEFNEGLGQFSPDGKWVAYQSDKTGKEEVYVRPFPGPGADVLISTNGGGQARWNPRRGELFYVGADDRLMAVPIRVAADGKSVEPGTPEALFPTKVGSTATLKYRQQYAVSPDGLSFIMNMVVGEPVVSPINVILNWRPVAR